MQLLSLKNKKLPNIICEFNRYNILLVLLCEPPKPALSGADTTALPSLAYQSLVSEKATLRPVAQVLVKTARQLMAC
jgi:hypothetical protein